MRKTISLILTLLLGTGLLATGAWAYTFSDTTLVQEWNGNGPYGSGPWVDVIGPTGIFDTKGANLSGNTLTIFSNWGVARNGYDAAYFPGGIQTADLFIDVGLKGTYNYAIQLNTLAGTGKVYANPSYSTSQDFFKNYPNLVYAGRFNNSNPQPVPTLITGGTISGTTSVIWTALAAPGAPDYSVAVDLSGLNLSGQDWGFVWGAGICGNDTFAGQDPVPGDQVPISPTVLLLGSGLLGLAGIGWKGKKS
jgi:hypothetical protein